MKESLHPANVFMMRGSCWILPVLIWFVQFFQDLPWNILVWEKKKEEKRFIRILRLTYGVTFVAFRDLGGGVGLAVGLRGGV